MLPVGRLYHWAYLVPDLRQAMDELGEVLDLEWASPAKRSAGTDHPHHGRQHVDFWITYSRTGPPHVELIEGVPGTLWDPAGSPRLHHVGLWVEDLHQASDRLAELGLARAGHGVDDDGDLARFAYHENAYGPLIELVAPSTREPFARWMSGEDLDLPT